MSYVNCFLIGSLKVLEFYIKYPEMYIMVAYRNHVDFFLKGPLKLLKFCDVLHV